ncbi:MAG: DUF4845 domain-containing protein [Gammaproteobacteria bacterium]|nr:DUF4845 domain-containing protein [Gammaproteobacteria bacterium]
MENFKRASNQKGASMWGLIGVAALIVLFSLVTMKLVPAYLDNNKVTHALESLGKTPGVGNWSRRQILDKIDNTLYIDMAADLLNLNEALKIRKVRNTKVISINYERVIPMAYNISALLEFENSVEVPLR